MSTIRVANRERFTIVSNATVRDKKLSFRARGVLTWLLSQPDDWRCDATVIAANGTEGRDAVRTALRELKDLGYIRYVKEQSKDGKWGTRADVYERPKTDSQASVTEDGKPAVGLPAVGLPAVGLPGAIRTTETKDLDERKPPKPPKGGGDAPGFEEFYALYPHERSNRAATLRRWNSLTNAERGRAEAALPEWVAYWAAKDEQGFIPASEVWLGTKRSKKGHQFDSMVPPLPKPGRADKRTATQVGNDMANGIVKEETLQFIETLAAIGEAK
jgi:hypothetical protein